MYLTAEISDAGGIDNTIYQMEPNGKDNLLESGCIGSNIYLTKGPYGSDVTRLNVDSNG